MSDFGGTARGLNIINFVAHRVRKNGKHSKYYFENSKRRNIRVDSLSKTFKELFFEVADMFEVSVCRIKLINKGKVLKRNDDQLTAKLLEEMGFLVVMIAKASKS
jgi:hypothetical protein